jgi:hypothetical protein
MVEGIWKKGFTWSDSSGAQPTVGTRADEPKTLYLLYLTQWIMMNVNRINRGNCFKFRLHAINHQLPDEARKDLSSSKRLPEAQPSGLRKKNVSLRYVIQVFCILF